ncbi:hypothetical protein GALMADRAFT_619803 [Galerina marginata CBS 339.88]|uniref:Uncharacterized protein n=1 Tax=Galerina marginata (strain CBS 339.88) TaxID=685588 RepID=A0A067SRR3_GALM3|nr:hypothetical protein GALMADRAFT_619803 [Galerina marginata CBS 339.88]
MQSSSSRFDRDDEDQSQQATEANEMAPPAKKVIARIYLVRHGETRENREGVVQGQRDTVLNMMGEEQARLVGERFRGERIDWALSSDLQRAAKTAEAILVHHAGTKLEMQKELRERNMGDMEGKRGSKLVAGADATIESSVVFSARAVGWWNQQILGHVLAKRNEAETMTVVVTTHGGFITTLVRALIGSRKVKCGPGVVVWRCMNASVTVIEVGENRKGTLVAYGDVSHLDGVAALESNADIVD